MELVHYEQEKMKKNYKITKTTISINTCRDTKKYKVPRTRTKKCVGDIFCSFIIIFIFVVPCLHKHLGTGEWVEA